MSDDESGPLATLGVFIGRRAVLVCDRRCSKAWGVNGRPHVPDAEAGTNPDDPDDFAYPSDDELGQAPRAPGTYEGGDTKPTDGRHNKWCWRECERSGMSEPGGRVAIGEDFSSRLWNKAPHRRPWLQSGAQDMELDPAPDPR